MVRRATMNLTIAVLLGSAGVSWSADSQMGWSAYRGGDYATALREWEPLSEQGHAVAQVNLGWMYMNGQGVPKNNEIALKWYVSVGAGPPRPPAASTGRSGSS